MSREGLSGTFLLSAKDDRRREQSLIIPCRIEVPEFPMFF